MLITDDGARLEAKGDWDAAAGFYRKQLLGDMEASQRARILCRLASCLWRDDRLDDAEDKLAEAARECTDIEDAAVLGEIRLEEGRLAEYRNDTRRAQARLIEAKHLLAQTEGSQEAQLACDLLLATVDRSRGELQSALAILSAIDEGALSPAGKAEYLDELGALHLARGDYRAAEETLTRALEYDVSGGTRYQAGRTRLLLAEALLGRGQRLQAKRHIEEALHEYQQVGDNRGLSDAKALLGQYHEESGRYVLAIREYTDGLELDDSSDDTRGRARALRLLGRTYRRKGDLARAQEYFDKARRALAPEDEVERAALFIEEGHLALDDADYREALDRFGRALAIAEEDGDARQIAIAKRHLSRALREQGNLRDAEATLREARVALEERGDMRELDELLDDLGEVLLELGRYQDALACLEESLAIDEQIGAVSSQGRSLLLAGQAHMQLGSRQSAGETLNRALEVYRAAGDEVGESEALYQLGTWHAQEGQLDEAIRCLRKGLQLDGRHDHRMGVVRATRSLAEAYRRHGDLDRARELVEEAENELGTTSDGTERALLDVEAANLAIARGAYGDAEHRLRKGMRYFEEIGSEVQAATCRRLLARAVAAQGNYTLALQLLEQARKTFVEANDAPELDELFDDLGEVNIKIGRLGDAAVAVQESLEMGRRMGWHAGKGRSLLLLCEIALRQNDLPKAHKCATDALRAYDTSHDEVGQAAAYLYLGDCALAERDYDRAVNTYKLARRLSQAHGDRRGVSRCYRKLGNVYLMRRDYGRAEESIEQAEEFLRGIDDPREQAPLLFATGDLQVQANNDHGAAVVTFRRALVLFKEFNEDQMVAETYQRLVASYHALGQTAEAMECISDMGLEHAPMWNILIKELNPLVSRVARPNFVAASYVAAVRDGFVVLESDIRRRATEALGESVASSSPISTVIGAWLKPGNAGVPPFARPQALQSFASLCQAAFDLIRNPYSHGNGNGRMTTVDAFVELGIAHLIAQRLQFGDGAEELA